MSEVVENSKPVEPERMTRQGPTRRWSPLRWHALQQAYYLSDKRFNIVPAGRRSGKSEFAKRRKVRKWCGYCGELDSPWVIFGAPTHKQAKRIFWKDLCKLVPSALVANISESEMTISLINDVDLTVMGMDVPERVEGRSISDGILDEYGNMRPEVWVEHISPGLADHGGGMDFTGTPEGRNHFYDLWLEALGQPEEWGCFTWTSETVLPPHEIASMKRRMDEMTYRQEALAQFVTFEGRAYHAFDQSIHCTNDVQYNHSRDLKLCFDFNVSPGVCAVVQELPLKRVSIVKEGRVYVFPELVYGVVGEVHIPQNSNTRLVCRRIVETYRKHVGSVTCFGDATGGARGTAKLDGSDWDIIRDELRPVFGERLRFRVPKENPRERVRVNRVNSTLHAVDGSVRLLVNPGQAPNVVKDLDGVRVIKGGSGEIDKKSDPKLTHLSDSIGYMLVQLTKGTSSTEQIG